MTNKTFNGMFSHACGLYFCFVHRPKIHGGLNKDLMANFIFSLSLQKTKKQIWLSDIFYSVGFDMLLASVNT